MIAKWRSSFYFRLVLSYTILALVLIGITGGYLLNNANQMVTHELTKDANYGLINVKEVVENNFLSKYEDAFFNKVLMTVNPSSASSEYIKYLLDQPAKGNIYSIVNFINDLGMVTQMTEGLDGITVYFRKSDYVIDQQRYYEIPEHSGDISFIQTLDSIPSNHWFMREKPDTADHKVMTYVFTLPYQSDPAKATGFLYLDINLNYLQKVVNSTINFPHSSLYMFDEKGQLILGGEKANSDEVEAVRNIAESSKRDSRIDSVTSRYGNKVISVLPANASSNHWTYVIVRPMESFLLSSDKMKRQVWIACLTALLGGLIISFLMSRHFYMPLKKLLFSIRNLYTGPSMVNEYEYTTINHMLKFIDLRMLQMKDQVRNKQITELITGQQSAADYGELLSIPLECRYVVVYIVTEPIGGELLTRRVSNQFGLAAEIVHLSANELALLVFIYDPKLETTLFVRSMLETFQSTLGGISFGAGIGSVTDSVEEINCSYQEAKQAYKYTFVQGREAIILFDEIASSRRSMLTLDIGYELFQHKVQAGNVTESEQWIDELTNQLQSNPQQIEMLDLICLRLVMVLSQVVIEQKFNDVFPEFIFHESFKRGTMDETMSIIKQQTLEIAKHIHESRNDVHLDKINELKAFIDEHMAEDLSLDKLAQRVNLSSNYVSTLFGTITGESFIAYLNRIRLNQAGFLLVSNPKLGLTEIATSVGYRNSQYFCTKFKAQFGITPLQYRTSEKLREQLAE